jgi:uncharacterized membrane protein
MLRTLRKASTWRVIGKATTWRIVGAVDTFLIAYFITGKIGAATGVVGLEAATKTLWYIGHEKIWDWLSA